MRPIICTLSLFLFLGGVAFATNYYVDATNGNDSFNGNSPEQAWRTLGRVNSGSYWPGDSILFRAGESWDGHLVIKWRGTADTPIVFTRFGDGAKPTINGNGGMVYAVRLQDAAYTEFSEFEVTNTGDTAQAGRLGVYITAISGDIHGVVVKNVDVHGVNGEVDKTLQSRETGAGSGIFWSNRGSSKGRLVDCLIQGCHVYDCQRNGISGAINREIRHLRLMVRQNFIEQVPGDGIIMNTCDSSIAEYNICRDFPNTLPDGNAAAGIWPFNSNNTIIQFNEVSGHNAPFDGQGYDCDWWCNNTLVQYNYSHNNSGGFILICAKKSMVPEGERSVNIGSVVRYNISIDDGYRTWGQGAHNFPSIYFHGVPLNTRVYNNTIYMSDKSHYLDGNDLWFVRVADWGEKSGWADSSFFYNNIFASVKPAKVEMTRSTNNFFDHNLFFNLYTITDKNGPLPNTNAILSDPGFVNIGGSLVDDYRLLSNSPAIASGRIIENNGGRDFFGNNVPSDIPPNIGACNAFNTSTGTVNDHFQVDLFHIFPHISAERIWMQIPANLENVKVSISSLTGQVISKKSFSRLDPGELEFDISEWPGGMYIIALENGLSSQAKLFIKR